MSLAQTQTPSGFPYPKYHDGIMVTIEDAIKTAWTTIKFKGIILSGNEDEITLELQDALQNMMDTGGRNGFNRKTFQKIVRGGNFKNYDGKHINKQPDLVFQLIEFRPGLTSSLHDAIFAECKIIGDGKSIVDYIRKGVRRFVDGEYAWAMPYSMMLAYVRDTSTLPSALESSYKRNKDKSKITKCAPKKNTIECCKLSKTVPKTYVTIHSRKWIHPEHGVPDDIEIRHIWLSVC